MQTEATQDIVILNPSGPHTDENVPHACLLCTETDPLKLRAVRIDSNPFLIRKEHNICTACISGAK